MSLPQRIDNKWIPKPKLILWNWKCRYFRNCTNLAFWNCPLGFLLDWRFYKIANFTFFSILICRVQRSALFLEFILYFDAILLTKYLYIFWLKNPGAVNEEFWSLFLHFSIKIFCFLSQTAWHLLVHQQPINYYICVGADPTEAMKKPLR